MWRILTSAEQRWFRENQRWTALKQRWSALVFLTHSETALISAEIFEISETALFSADLLWDFNPGSKIILSPRALLTFTCQLQDCKILSLKNFCDLIEATLGQNAD